MSATALRSHWDRLIPVYTLVYGAGRKSGVFGGVKTKKSSVGDVGADVANLPYDWE